MAYGLIYNLNFASNIGDRKHRLSIYKDGHTATITTSDNNIIGTEEPVEVIWDANDDIYSNFMPSRLEINLYSDDTKQVDIDDILSSTSVNKFKVIYFIENSSNVLEPYWEGYISNATFEQGISSTPKTYRLIATDLLGLFKNIFSTDGTAVVDSQENVIKYIDNVMGFLPQVYNYKISNDIEIKTYMPYGVTTQYRKFHTIQWVSATKDSLELAYDNAYDYLQSTLKAFNSRLFYADGYWHIINNCSYADTASFDYYNSNGTYSSTASENVVKTIPTNLQPIGNDLNVRYDTPYDVVEVIAHNNPYATQFDINDIQGLVNNLSMYPSFETKVNGILFNDTYYSDNYTTSNMDDAYVKTGNYSIKTNTFISSGTPTLKILDTGFQGDFQYNPPDADGVLMYFYTSFYLSQAGQETYNITMYYSLLRETASSADGSTGLSRSYYNGSTWVAYTNEANATKLSYNVSAAGASSWNDIQVGINPTGTAVFARYRVILWRPKKTDLGDVNMHIDHVFIGRNSSIDAGDTVRTRAKLSTSTRRNKRLTYEFTNFFPINRFGTFVKLGTSIVPTYLAQQNEVITQQILNDNRTHIKRYTVSTTPVNNDIIYPYHKIDIDFSNYTSTVSGIIDRMRYKAKSNIYELEFHEPNQATNVSIDIDLVR